MRLLFSCVGKRGYIVAYFREILGPEFVAFGSGITPWTPGAASCDEFVLMPEIDEPEYLRAVLDCCERNRIDGILSFSDPDVVALSSIREEFLDRGVVPVLPAHEGALRAFDKLATHDFLRAMGLPCPVTFGGVDQALDEWQGAAIVKPRFGSGSANVFHVKSKEELRVFARYSDDMLIQEYVRGVEVNADVLCDLNGRPQRVSLWRKHRSQGGETEHAETIDDPEIGDLVWRLLHQAALIGPGDVDIIVGRDGPSIIEINARFGGGYPVSHLAGAGFPEAIVDLIRGQSIEERRTTKPGIVMMKALDILVGDVVEQRLRSADK